MSDWSDLSRPTPDWFTETPLGIFLHWGAYSVPGWAEPTGELGTIDGPEWNIHNPYAEWYYNTSRIEGSPAQQHHHDVWHDCSYDDFLDMWQAENFDPASWMDLFVRAGAGYVVPTTKHHDGITLWDAKGTDGRNTVHRGPKRDLVRELGDAARAAGLRYGLYYSGGIDWHFCGNKEVVDPELWDETLAQSREYADYAFDHCVELIDNYRPDILWDDINWPEAGKGDGPKDLHALFRHYRDVVPDGLLNDRWGVDFSDYRTSEYQAMKESEDAEVWENCRGIGLSFGWNRNEGPEQYLTGGQIARHLVDVCSRGGHLLLNLGPKADGTLEPLQVASMEQLAQWMSVAKPYVRIARKDASAPTAQPTPTAEPVEARVAARWERRIPQPGGRTAVFLDDAETVTLYSPAGEAVSGCRVEATEHGLVVTLDADRVGPAVVLV